MITESEFNLTPSPSPTRRGASKKETMNEQRDRLIKRNDQIRDEYLRIYKQGYRHEYVVTRLQEKYFLARDTLERIVQKSGVYKEM